MPYNRVCRIRRKETEPKNQQYEDYLAHYGIKGQQWGIRRYQNEDGTLTEEGKLRYNEGTPESKTWKKSEASQLTDDELRRRNNRLQAEQQYRNLTTTDLEREKAQRKKEIINKVIIGTAVSLAAVAMRGKWQSAAKVIGKYGKRAITKLKTSVALKRGPDQLRNLGEQYSHAKGSLRNFRAGQYRKTFRYHPKNYGGIPRNPRWPKT